MSLTYKSLGKRRIVADDEKCNGCLICQLRCSFRFEKAFNIVKAAIKVDTFAKGGTDYYISFTEKCDACGICAKNCPYGALTWFKERKEVA